MTFRSQGNLKSQIIVHHKHDDSFLVSASSCNYNLIADAVGAHTVVTSAVDGAGCVFVKAYGVRGRGNVSDPVECLGNIGRNLVHTCNYDYVLGSEDEACKAVAVAVNVHKLAVKGDCVCAHNEVIAEKCGFAELSYFSKKFKDIKGYTPTTARKNKGY